MIQNIFQGPERAGKVFIGNIANGNTIQTITITSSSWSNYISEFNTGTKTR